MARNRPLNLFEHNLLIQRVDELFSIYLIFCEHLLNGLIQLHVSVSSGIGLNRIDQTCHQHLNSFDSTID